MNRSPDSEQWPLGHLRGEPIGPVISFDGTPLHAEAIGSGPTVVMAHGFCLGLTSWHYQMRELSGSFRLVLYDQRGHGLSAFPETRDFSIDALARDLDAVVRAAGGAAILVGHSMGGMTVLRWASMFPDRLGRDVEAIALVDTNAADVLGGLLPGAARLALPALHLIEAVARAAAPERLESIRKSQPRLIRTGVRLMSFAPEAPEERLAFVERLFGSVPMRTLIPVVRTLRTLDVRAGLERIDIPTLVVVGARDRLTPPSVARRLAQEIERSELATIARAGHMPMLEQPEVFNELLAAFLERPGAVYGGRRVGRARLPQMPPD